MRMANFFSRGRCSEQQQRLKSRGVAPRKCLASLPYNSRGGGGKGIRPLFIKIKNSESRKAVYITGVSLTMYIHLVDLAV